MDETDSSRDTTPKVRNGWKPETILAGEGRLEMIFGAVHSEHIYIYIHIEMEILPVLHTYFILEKGWGFSFTVPMPEKYGKLAWQHGTQTRRFGRII